MSVRRSIGAGGLDRLELAHPSGSSAEVYLHGAHVASWVPAGREEALFVSRAAVFEPGSAIRGGIPVVFPQFAELGPLPKHGFARTRPWDWVSGPDEDRVRLRLQADADTLAIWPFAFTAELTVELGEHTLRVELEVGNPGTEAFTFSGALHTYFRVADAAEVALLGLEGVRYRSRQEGVDGGVDRSPVVGFAGEVDRVYLDAPEELVLRDAAGGRELRIGQTGFRDVVVWNPGAEKAAALPDMLGGEQREMVCVEAAQVGEPVRLEPGTVWRGAQVLRA